MSKARRLASSDSFTVITSTGGSKTATLAREYAAGTYLIEAVSSDPDLAIYLASSSGSNVGVNAVTSGFTVSCKCGLLGAW